MNRKTKILIIDDEADFCHFIKINLENARNYKVFTSNNGLDGIETALKKQPDLVLLDIMMPKMNGFEVLKILKKNVKTTSIPVVMLTALDTEESMMKAFGSYSQDYLIKPISINKLLLKIDKMLSSQSKLKA